MSPALGFTDGAMVAVDDAPEPPDVGLLEFRVAGCEPVADAESVALAGTFTGAGAAGFAIAGPAEQQPFGTTVFGAATPAISEPKPNF
ncbi:MAG TPA: hypothetical protein VNK23_06825 [Candidatus Dormibacteraeota bacterium]|nr:hypothetical protein [Candidatus Dormibacteraeota bacterium]